MAALVIPVTLEVEVPVLNGASFGAAVSPGSWIVIRGSNLASSTRIWTGADFNGEFLPTVLDGTSVRVGNRNAAVYYISPTQINALLPADAEVGPATMTVTSPAPGGTASANIVIAPFAPGIFMFSPENSRYIAAVHPDGTLVGKPGLFGAGVQTRPLGSGQRAAFYVTGLGSTDPPVPPGQVFTDPRPIRGSSS
jgi:uncharacterized protein (TIGR03437 family)